VRRKEHEKALADSAEAIRLWPSYIDMYSLRADIFRNEGQIDKAVEEAESLVAANSDYASAYIAAGAIYYSVKKKTEALHAFDRAVEIEPDEASYLARARYRPRTDMAGKRSDAEAALKLNPRSLNALGMLAWIQAEAREYVNAVETLNAALAIKDGSYSLLIQRGIAYAKSDRSALADKDFAAARAKATSATDLNNICWQLATAGVALASALDACDSALAKGQAWPAFNDSRGFVLLRLGRYDDAIAAYDAALKAVPTFPGALYGRGIAKRRKGDVSGGDADIQAALAANANIGEEFATYGVTPESHYE
jgi:tetratricopeptide (TPR) repeat protein